MQVRAGRLFREISEYRVYFFFFLESYFTYKCRCSASTHLWLNTDTDTKKVQERSNRWVISKQLSGIYITCILQGSDWDFFVNSCAFPQKT